ncbi:hypothetical protein MPNT_10106 [Candidatus Methylacidithermus pantelleriae]|uniref:Uncharacterized protein n=1 Tax=Candidatus Methylacidithermus pantelleriae TaxID=2744239 RepID=A0A8J2FRI9_9BACT|nr:hypothetical protein MPNT_10106 [Candidatus Methylacidithermus pantelleriae]
MTSPRGPRPIVKKDEPPKDCPWVLGSLQGWQSRLDVSLACLKKGVGINPVRRAGEGLSGRACER